MKTIRVEDRYVYCVLHADDLYTTRNTHTHAHTSIASYDSEEEQAKIVQYSTVQYITLHYSSVQYSTVQYSTVQYSTVQYITVQYSTVQYSTVHTCPDP